MTDITPEQAQEELLDAAVAARESRIALARVDPLEFNNLILRDIVTGKPIEPAPMHEEWHDAITENDRLIIRSCPETGKTQGISIGRTLFEIGKNPDLRVAVASVTVDKAGEIVGTIATHIESNDELHQIFPDLVPTEEEKEPWQSKAITVKRRVGGRDPTVQALGVGSKVVGSRIDLLILDDILDLANTRTKYQREKVWIWLNREVFARLSENARIVMMVNAYHRDDSSHRFQKRGWHTIVNAAWDEETGELLWPEKWPRSRCVRKKQDLPPAEYAREVLCIPPDEADSRFRPEWIQACLARGIGRRLARFLTKLPGEGFGVYTGVDLGVSQKGGSDLSSIVTVLVYPNGDRQPLAIESGRWSGMEIISRIFDTWSRFHSVIYVEDNAAQAFLLQFLAEFMKDGDFGEDPPIILAHTTTGRNKSNPIYGVESLAVELQKAMWIMPSIVDPTDPKGRLAGVDEELEELLEEIRTYNPGRHTGDRLMALWIAREAIRKHHGIEEGGGIEARLVGPGVDEDEVEFD